MPLSQLDIFKVFDVYSELDWETPLKSVEIWRHWRLLICAFGGGLLSTSIWHAVFPHAFWFMKAWAGFATGMALSLIPGMWWQVCDAVRRRSTSGKLTILGAGGWGLFSCIAFLTMAPEFAEQERNRSMIRSLNADDIVAVSFRRDGEPIRRIEDASSIASFVDCTRQAELFFPSHEGSLHGMELKIEYADGKMLRFAGRVPERHTPDFTLYFSGPAAQYEIIIPGGYHWIGSGTRRSHRTNSRDVSESP